jgi:hypothetical protein
MGRGAKGRPIPKSKFIDSPPPPTRKPVPLYRALARDRITR